MLKETKSTHLVKGSDLNHHGTLFAGKMAEWFTETCFLAAARYLERPDDVVCLKIHGLSFTQPARPGDTVEIVASPARTGTTSITVGTEVFINDRPEPTVRGFATFVSVDAEGRPYPHGLVLPEAWKSAHAGLCADAERLPR